MWPNPQETADLVTFTEAVLITFTDEILNVKLHFLCSFNYLLKVIYLKSKFILKFVTLFPFICHLVKQMMQ